MVKLIDSTILEREIVTTALSTYASMMDDDGNAPRALEVRRILENLS